MVGLAALVLVLAVAYLAIDESEPADDDVEDVGDVP